MSHVPQRTPTLLFNDRMRPPTLDEVMRVPHGRTARRLEWQHLHPDVRAVVEARLGSPVAAATSHLTGFTPGFASSLTAADGSCVFVKAASKVAQRQIAASYAEEARKLSLLPQRRLPATRLAWSHEDDGWVVLGFECVDGRPPARPWVPAELDTCLDTLTEVASVMTDPDPGLHLVPLHEDMPTLLSGWSTVATADPDWPHLAEAAELAASFEELPDADHFVHADARDDNFLLTSDGRALLCDWNWPGLGPAWLDSVTLLVSAHGDGRDADALLRAHPLTADAPADHVDAWLAALCGFMLESDFRPVPPSSPNLGTHRRWWAAATWDWLARRRGWDG